MFPADLHKITENDCIFVEFMLKYNGFLYDYDRKECGMKMPGFVIHLLHGQFVLENIFKDFDDKQTEQFMQGILMPDSNEKGEKDTAHFVSLSPDSQNRILKTPDMGLFISKYKQQLTEPFVIGYFAHLYLDKAFFEQFFPNYVSFVDENDRETPYEKRISRVYLSRSQKYISVGQLFSEEYLYGDYTMLNAVLTARYSLTVPGRIKIENPIQEVRSENFVHILSELKKYLKQQTVSEPELNVFVQSELENFIHGQADEFVKYYRQCVGGNDNAPKQEETDENGINLSSIEEMEKCWQKGMQWDLDCAEKDQPEKKCCIKKIFGRSPSKSFDLRSEEYYHIAWLDLCKEANADTAGDILFMDRLILRARYVHERKENEKNKYFAGEKRLINLTLVNTTLNALKFYHANNLIEKAWPDNSEVINMWIDNSLGILCVFISAWTAWFTSRLLLGAHKETWLRHMSFYSKITLEADSLFAGAGEYKGLSAARKIALFKAKTVAYTEVDYQNFFANMSGSKSSGGNSGSETGPNGTSPDNSAPREQNT